MQMRQTALIGLGLILCTACDPIRLPTPDSQTEPAAETQSEAEAVDTLANAETPPASLETETETSPGEAGDIAGTVIAPTPVMTAEPITDLAALNARICGLAVQPIDGSPTLAEVSGARPVDEDIVATATVNGTSAQLSQYPGLVKMEPRAFRASGAIASGHCGATRIAQNWFITAAHCLDDDYDEVRLITGAENLSSPWAVIVEAEASLCHAAYGGAAGGYVNDIALLRVDDAAAEQLETLTTAIYATTQERFVPLNYDQARMAGWGLTAFNGSLSQTLLEARLGISETGPAAISVASQDGAGPCIGDSGGPLFIDEADGQARLVGVLSVVEQNTRTGGFCEGDYGARYTNLHGYKDWILDVMRSCDATPELCGID